MKKLIPLFLLLLTIGYVSQSCSDSKTYAEQMEDERRAISKFISQHNIKVISAEEFEKSGYKTDTTKNEYVQMGNGVYMQIYDKGSVGVVEDSIRDRDVVTVRFMEYDIMVGDTTYASNYYIPHLVDVFDYTLSGTTAYGQFRQGMMYQTYGYSDVPEGWLTPLRYIGNKARVKLIVPHKVGHREAMETTVKPYYYDLRRIQLW